MNCLIKFIKSTDFNKTKIVHFNTIWKNNNYENNATFYYICLPKRALELEQEFKILTNAKINYEIRTKDKDVVIFITEIETEKSNKVAQLYQKLMNYDLSIKLTLEKVQQTCAKKEHREELINILNERMTKLNSTLDLNATANQFEDFKNKKFWLEQAIILLKEIIKEGEN